VLTDIGIRISAALLGLDHFHGGESKKGILCRYKSESSINDGFALCSQHEMLLMCHTTSHTSTDSCAYLLSGSFPYPAADAATRRRLTIDASESTFGVTRLTFRVMTVNGKSAACHAVWRVKRRASETRPSYNELRKKIVISLPVTGYICD
jgi:hypothetical protein